MGRRRGTRNGRGIICASVLAGLFVAAPAAADDQEELEGLLDEQVVSGASKTDEIAKDAPSTTSVITAQDMHRYGIRSLAEAINFLGMGLVTQDPLHSVEIGGRGVLLTADFGNHVLLVVDGHTLNEPWDGTAYFEQGAAIPLELIDHIELVLGPGSVLYGGNAMFGVVNIVTKRAAAFKGLHFTADGSLSPQQGKNGTFTSFAPADLGGSYRLGTGFGHEFPLFGKRAEIVAQAEFYGQNGPSFLWGPQSATNDDGTPKNFGPRTPLGTWGGRVNSQYTTTVPTLYARGYWGDFALTFRAAQYSRRTPYPNAFNQLATDFDEPRTYERDRFISADLRYDKHVSRNLRVTARGYADAYDFYQPVYASNTNACSPATVGPCYLDIRGRSRWIGTELQAHYDWLGGDKLTTMLGVNGTVRDIGGVTTSLEANTLQPVGVQGERALTEFVWAAYLQQRYNPVSILHLNAGARFDADPRGGDRVSPRAAVALDAWQGGVLKVSYSEAFRAPTFYEAFYESPIEKANPGIRSETVRGAEASIEQRAGRHTLFFGVFRSWWSDMLSLRTVSDSLYEYENLSRIDNYGYNARLDGAFGSFRYGASVTGAYTRRTTPESVSPLPVAPQLYGNLRGAYVLPDPWPTVALATTFVGKRMADRGLDGNFAPTPYAAASAEIRLTLSQAVPGVKGLGYRVGASFVTGTVSPYVAGPIQGYDSTVSTPGPAELSPVIRFTTFATLHYDLPL